MSSALSPVLGVKKSLFRLHDPFREEADENFRKIRLSALARDRFVCQFCKIPTTPSEGSPSGYFHVHHRDNNHRNNVIGNLVTACPFCHQVFHAGMAAHGAEPGHLILLSEMGQWELNRLCHIVFAAMIAGESSSDPADKEIAKGALALYRELQDRSFNVKKTFGEDTAKLSSLAKGIARLPEELYDKRERAVGSLRILPIRDAFERETAYWSANLIKVLPLRSWGGLASRTLSGRKKS